MDVHPQVRALLDADEVTLGIEDPPDLATLRAGYAKTAARLGGLAEEVARVDDVAIARPGGPPVPVRAYVPAAAADPLGALVWNHGGGWIMGDLDGFDRVARALANASGHVVVSVDYRLAPEHPYPAAVDDAEAAVRWAACDGAARLGHRPELLAIGGDSSGGQVAAAAALRAAELLRAQLLVYPALDPGMDSAAYAEYGDGPMLTAAEMAACWAAYASGGQAIELPSEDDIGRLPPAWLAVAGHDPLRDDGLAYAERLRAAGVPVEARDFEDMVHGFLRWGGVVERAHELVAWLGTGARAALSS